jgi:hypothetical protein
MDPFRQTLRASPFRRLFGAGIQGVLGIVLLQLAVTNPPSAWGWQAFLVAAGLAALWAAWRGWQGSAVALVLDERGLFQEDGVPVAPLDAIEAVDRALFTFKPSNGFLVVLRAPLGRAWVPGMWWRVGRRVGVGGVTGGAETKMVADALSMMVAQRDAREDGPRPGRRTRR